MVQADKTKLIQYLQVKHAEWLEDFNTALSVGRCVEDLHQKNIWIHYLIRVIYRYPADEDLDTGDERCLTSDELDAIVCKIMSLVSNCGC